MFKNLIGNEHVKQTMRHLIAKGRVPNSLLFAGDEGIGKRQFAIELCRSLICADPTEGEGLAARVVATDVVPDVERGPAWMPDSRRIAYVRDEREAYNPIYIADVDSRTSTLVRTGTKMNHDVTCSPGGVIA